MQAAAYDNQIKMQEMTAELAISSENSDEIKKLKIYNYDKAVKIENMNYELASVKADVISLKGALMTLVGVIKKSKEAGKRDQKTREKENREISGKILQLHEDTGKILRRIIPGKGKPANGKKSKKVVQQGKKSKKVVQQGKRFFR